MSLALIVVGVVALMLPGMRSANLWHGRPQWFVPMNAIALVLGLAAVTAGLALSVGVGAVHLIAGASLLTYSGHLAPGGIIVSAASTGLLAFVVVTAIRSVRGARRAIATARADSWLGQHTTHHDLDVVIVPTDDVVAYAVGHRDRQVVISEGLRDRLDRDEVAFVIDHERAHLQRGHRRYLLLATVVDAVFGAASLVARSTLALRLAIERVADEDAAGRDPVRRHRASAGLERLSAADGPGVPEALAYRARLLATPVAAPSRIEAIAGGGLLALALSVLWLAEHTTGDIPALLALLHH